jgi:hypothetical protein
VDKAQTAFTHQHTHAFSEFIENRRGRLAGRGPSGSDRQSILNTCLFYQNIFEILKPTESEKSFKFNHLIKSEIIWDF